MIKPAYEFRKMLSRCKKNSSYIEAYNIGKSYKDMLENLSDSEINAEYIDQLIGDARKNQVRYQESEPAYKLFQNFIAFLTILKKA